MTLHLTVMPADQYKELRQEHLKTASDFLAQTLHNCKFDLPNMGLFGLGIRFVRKHSVQEVRVMTIA